ncbi:MAG TPA: STAS domain-containing protein [Catenuloplanes sp.]|jgi:anti-sigma B factor antagonist
MGFTMRSAEQGAVTVVQLLGELDMATAGQLQARLDELTGVDRCRVLLDLSGLDFCDSAGLNAFIRGERCCRRRGGWLRVTAPRDHVATVMRLSGLDEALLYNAES